MLHIHTILGNVYSLRECTFIAGMLINKFLISNKDVSFLIPPMLLNFLNSCKWGGL